MDSINLPSFLQAPHLGEPMCKKTFLLSAWAWVSECFITLSALGPANVAVASVRAERMATVTNLLLI